MGSLMNITDNVASREKLSAKLEKQYRERMEKIFGKERAERELKEHNRRFEERRAKGGRHIKAELTGRRN